MSEEARADREKQQARRENESRTKAQVLLQPVETGYKANVLVDDKDVIDKVKNRRWMLGKLQ